MLEAVHPLKVVGLKVLEDWALMLVDEVNEVDSSLLDPEQKTYVSSVDFKGTISGTVSILAQHEFIENLTSNLLGLDRTQEILESDCQDAFREMGNVLAGNFLTEAYGTDVVFELINPSVAEVGADTSELFDRKVRFAFSADDQPVIMTFNLG